MASIMAVAFWAAFSSTEAISTRPSCSMSILTPVSAVILLMTLPPGPMTSRIFSGLISMVMIRGAKGDSWVHGDAADRRLDGHARIHQGECRPAHGGHGGRAVGL